MSDEISRRNPVKRAMLAIEKWKRRITRWPATVVWTLAGFAIGGSAAFPSAAMALMLSLLFMNHLQLAEPVLGRTQVLLSPVSLLWWHHPAIGDLYWWRGVLANAVVFAGAGAIFAEIKLGTST